MNELNKLYREMLISWGGVIKDNGEISYRVSGEEYPITIDGMKMHLPLSEVLDGNVIDKVFFHPACENILSKETEVFKLIRKMTGMALLTKFREIPLVLFELAGKEKKSWKQDVLDMVVPLKGVKKTVRTELNKLFSTMTVVNLEEDGTDNRFIHFRVTKGGGRSSNGERVYYKTIPQFPFYAEIVKKIARTEGNPDNHQIELNGNSYSRGCLKLALHLFQHVMPAVSSPDDYTYESTNPVAARMTSYLGCYGEIASQLNRTQNLFRSEFDKAGYYVIDLDWMEFLEDLPEIYRQVPALDYNSHDTSEAAVSEVVSKNNISNMMNVSTNQPAKESSQGKDVTSSNETVNQSSNDVIMTPTGHAVVVKPPLLQPGEQYIKYELDYSTPSPRVYHHVSALNGNLVLYHTTKDGNVLTRTETPQYPQQQMMFQNQMHGFNNMGMQNGFHQGFGNPFGMYQPATASNGIPQPQPQPSYNVGYSNNDGGQPTF